MLYPLELRGTENSGDTILNSPPTLQHSEQDVESG
jgi:hypothetical protein